MEQIVNYDNLRSFAYSNDKLIKGEVRGIVLRFFGLGTQTIFDTDPGDAIDFAEQGIIYVAPYYNPWAWMNRQTVRLVDRIVEVLVEKYNLGEGVRIVSTGSSMGGLSALVYCVYAKVTPCALVANCPVCDLPYHYGERPDLPRTLYSAFGEYECSLEEALRSASPIHLVNRMPKIRYRIFHCTADKMVDCEIHSQRFVDKMANAHDITLRKVPMRAHCELSAEAALEYNRAIIEAIEG